MLLLSRSGPAGILGWLVGPIPRHRLQRPEITWADAWWGTWAAWRRPSCFLLVIRDSENGRRRARGALSLTLVTDQAQSWSFLSVHPGSGKTPFDHLNEGLRSPTGDDMMPAAVPI